MSKQFLIVTADAEVLATDDREQAEAYANNDDNVVIDLQAWAVIDEDGDEIDAIKPAPALESEEPEEEEEEEEEED